MSLPTFPLPHCFKAWRYLNHTDVSLHPSSKCNSGLIQCNILNEDDEHRAKRIIGWCLNSQNDHNLCNPILDRQMWIFTAGI